MTTIPNLLPEKVYPDQREHRGTVSVCDSESGAELVIHDYVNNGNTPTSVRLAPVLVWIRENRPELLNLPTPETH